MLEIELNKEELDIYNNFLKGEIVLNKINNYIFMYKN